MDFSERIQHDQAAEAALKRASQIPDGGSKCRHRNTVDTVTYPPEDWRRARVRCMRCGRPGVHYRGDAGIIWEGTKRAVSRGGKQWAQAT